MPTIVLAYSMLEAFSRIRDEGELGAYSVRSPSSRELPGRAAEAQTLDLARFYEAHLDWRKHSYTGAAHP